LDLEPVFVLNGAKFAIGAAIDGKTAVSRGIASVIVEGAAYVKLGKLKLNIVTDSTSH
jgi:hypothetical protein